MKQFDLMKDRPELDTNTLNFVWDYLWRMNFANQRKNQDQRARCYEREQIMKFLEEMAE